MENDVTYDVGLPGFCSESVVACRPGDPRGRRHEQPAQKVLWMEPAAATATWLHALFAGLLHGGWARVPFAASD